MAGLFKSRPTFNRAQTDDSKAPVELSSIQASKQDLAVEGTDGLASLEKDGAPEVLPTEAAQRGVRDVESITLTWSKWTLCAVFLKYVSTKIRHDDLVLTRYLVQHLDALLHQRLPVVSSVFIASLRHKQLRDACPLEHHLRCCGCHDRRPLHPVGENYGCLGPS